MSKFLVRTLYRTPDWAWAPVRAIANHFSPGGTQGTLSILIYHRINKAGSKKSFDFFSERSLDWQMHLISKVFNPLPLKQAIDHLQAGTLPARAIAVTFDDGYADNLTLAMPILEKYGIRGTCFVAGIGIKEGRLWNDKLIDGISQTPSRQLNLDHLGLGQHRLNTANQRRQTITLLLHRLKQLHPDTQRQQLDAILAAAQVVVKDRLILSEAQVSELSQRGMDIGCHTMNHPMLSRVDLDYARDDICSAKAELERLINKPVELFAYPYGKPNEHFLPVHQQLAKELGFCAALSTAWGSNNRYSDMFSLKRFTPWDDNPLKFLVRLLWNYRSCDGTPAIEDRDKALGCLLVTSVFPPINGGSAVVYEKLAYYNPGSEMMVLAPKFHCATREHLDGWQAFDQRVPYPVQRLDLLRPWVLQSRSIWHSLYLLARYDYPLRLRVLLTTLWLIKKHRIKTICIGELNSLSWLGLVCRKLTGVKVINYIHGEEVTTETVYRRFGRKRRSYLHSADAVVAVSQFTKQFLEERYGLPADKVKLIPNGVDIAQFYPGERSSLLTERYQLANKKVLLTVGRLVPRKGIDKTIEALPLLLKQMPELHYLIVGTGPYRDALEALVDQFGVRDHVTFAGRVAEEELALHYQLCDLFLMPNREMPDKDTEGFGLVFLEANACLKPVIGGRAGGAVEAVLHEQNGLSVNGEHPEEIAAAIERIFNEPGLADRLATKGLEVARKSSFEYCAQAFQQLYRQLGDS